MVHKKMISITSWDVLMYLENGFPVEMPVCPKCGFVYVPEELALGKVLAVERALEDK